jgi:hypothetical protein
MTTEDKIKILIDRGYSYDKETGFFYSPNGLRLVKKDNSGYAVIGGIRMNNKRLSVRGHQFAFYLTHGYLPKYVDHIDENKSNNVITNLRAADSRMNSYNRRKTKGYRFNGFSYTASIVINRKNIHLGSFETEEDARLAYLSAKESEMNKVCNSLKNI